MDRLESYRDLCSEIELWELRLDDLNRERNYYIKKMSQPPQTKLCATYDGMPKAGMAAINFVDLFGKVQMIDEHIAEAKDILSLKREAKRNMERVIGQFDRLEYQVAYKRDIEGKPLTKISEELNISYDWTRQLSRRIKRLRQEQIS